MQTKKHFNIFGSALAVLCSVLIISSSAITGFAAEGGDEAAADAVYEQADLQENAEDVAPEVSAPAEDFTEDITEEAEEQPTEAIAEEEVTVPVNNDKEEDEELSAAPGVPNPKLSNVSDGIKLEWDEIDDAKQYYVCATESGTNVWQKYYTEECEFLYKNLQSGKQYYFQVQTISNDGTKSAFSSPRGLTYLAAPALNAVVNSFEDDGTLKLSWSAVKGANKYKIAKIRSDSDSYEYIDVTSNSYTDTKVYDGYTYRYQVRAMYSTEKNGTAYGWWSTSSSAKIAVWPNIALKNANGGICATWDPVKNTARYIVFCREASESTWTRAVTTNLTYTFKGLKSGKLYYCQLYSDSTSGKDGKFSMVRSITYIAAPEVTVSSTAKAVAVSWNKVAGAEKYQLARKTSDSNKYEYYFLTGTSYTDANVPAGKSCYYQVRAIGSDNSGEVFGYWSTTKFGEMFIKPEISSLGNKSNGISVGWSQLGNASSYTLYFKEASQSGWSSAETKNNSITVTGTKTGKLYFLQIRYTGLSGGKSSFSDVKSITFTKQGTLTSLSASKTAVNLKWAQIDDVDYYVIEKYNATTNKKYYLTVENATAYKDTVISYYQTYYYRVCGVHRESEAHRFYENAAGAYSNQIRINPQAYVAVSTALTQQGEKGYKFCNDMNKGKLVDWCAIFAGWSLKQGGFDLTKCGYHANVGNWCDNLYSLGLFEYSGSYTPNQGDVIIFGTSSFRSHIGVVVGVNGNYVTTIEGNAAVPSSYSGDWMANSYVVKNEYSLDNYRIYGYGRMTVN